MHARLLQSCPTLCDTMDCSPPGSSVYGILQARTLERGAILSSRRSRSRDLTCDPCISCIAGRFFTHWANQEALLWILAATDIIYYFCSLFKFYTCGIKCNLLVHSASCFQTHFFMKMHADTIYSFHQLFSPILWTILGSIWWLHDFSWTH